ncbi:hypothetical protein ZHAS_00017996 [Anopheles sinensis]|uniref:Uncharacterized protein n=1 Tax=Anopheles sinensis TaxID=74873 RepID=A0A084WIB5_ANOSI|nr:hypothetical protein ZHAS_00017996 [Anopheles sinensis]
MTVGLEGKGRARRLAVATTVAVRFRHIISQHQATTATRFAHIQSTCFFSTKPGRFFLPRVGSRFAGSNDDGTPVLEPPIPPNANANECCKKDGDVQQESSSNSSSRQQSE